MGKTRRKIGQVVSTPEGAPIKKKEPTVDTRSDEQKVFDMGLKDKGLYEDRTDRVNRIFKADDAATPDNDDAVIKGKYRDKGIAGTDNFYKKSAGDDIREEAIANSPTLQEPMRGYKDSSEGNKVSEIINTPQSNTLNKEPEIVPVNAQSKLLYDLNNDNAPKVTGQTILKTGTENAQTSTDLFNAPSIAKDAEKEAEKMQSQGAIAAANTLDTIQDEEPPLGGNSVTIDAATGKTTVVGNGKMGELKANQGNPPMMKEVVVNTNKAVDQTSTMPEFDPNDPAELQYQAEKQPIAPVTANVMANINQNPTRPSYPAVATNKDVANDLAKQYSAFSDNLPGAVVEKLGVQDYYPEVGRDIAVGTFSGSRIGSQTIYSGAGGLLPMGLYDARKRALNESAKTKQAEIDKILSIPDTTPQLKESYSQYAYNTLYDDLARNGFNPTAYLRDKKAMQNKFRLESVAKNLTYSTERAKAMLDSSVGKDGKPGTYIPPDLKKKMTDFLSGAVDNSEDYYSGKKDISSLTNEMKTYSNGTVWIDERRDKWVQNPTEAPLNLKTGKTLTDANIAEINGAVKAIQDGSPDSDSYMTVLKKYYDIDPAVVDRWADNEGYAKDDPARENLKEYMRYQIPAASFVATVKTMANQNVARARLDLDRDKFNYQKQSDKESYFGTINANINDAVNKQTGKTFNQEIAELQKSGLTGTALNDAIGNVWKQYGYGAAKLNSKGYYSTVIPASQALSKDITAKDVFINGKPQRTIKVAIHVKNKNTGKWDWKEQEMTPSEISAYRSKVSQVDKYGKVSKQGDYALYAVDEGGVKTKMSASDLENYGKAQSTVFTKVVSHQIAKGYYDTKGRFHFLNDQNIGAYNSSDRKATLARDIEQPYSKTPSHNDKTMQVNYVEELLPGQMVGEWTRIDNQAGQQNKDQQSGYKVNQAAEAQGSPDTSYGSSESGGFNISTPQ